MNDMPDLPTCVLNRASYIGVIPGTEESQGDLLATLAASDIDIYCACHLVFHATIHVPYTTWTARGMTQAVSLRSVAT
jgi:hypothetical protein